MKIKVPEIYLPFSLLEIFRVSLLVKTGIAVHFQVVPRDESRIDEICFPSTWEREVSC